MEIGLERNLKTMSIMRTSVLFSILFFTVSSLSAQKINITGKVVDETETPLPGVIITVGDTDNSTHTDFDGNYKISAKIGEILFFTYLGMKTERVTVTENTIINVVMSEDSEMLEEVVVAGYSVSKALSGRVGGVYVGSNYGAGILTAGEINDIQDFQEWRKTLKRKEYQKIQEDWGFYLENKLEVSIANNKNEPLANISVKVFNDNPSSNSPIMKTKTDAFGKAIIFKDLHSRKLDEYYYVQVQHNSKIHGKKINANAKTVDFTLNEKSVAKNVDIMFTIDATGSMGDEMDYLKEELRDIINRIDDNIGSKRVALTFYRDVNDEYLTRDFDFDSDIEKVQRNLNRQSANGGGDYQEAVDEALKVSMSKSWDVNAKAKLLFFLLDAPPHLTEQSVGLIQKQIKIAQEKGVKIVPVVASGADKTVEFLMRFFSVSTNGTYVFLTDDSGIGNKHLKPTKEDYSVEKLNDIIVRIVKKYARV
ncbi:carboxypeptidase-like regulatory domain-containing protein [Muricauda sp. 2012CJ35-5]|uniref:Carboxypeptidase-like regulatory domain-containing protein n=1 Tax=Flagellimonas spongiicola TaxID=2942208 RepID=A0ABT0PQ90_9FLAO|nr:vWA domain-containing protein [Allomuricauda spongiicola]MCL6273557.1 carboxypeptidase-like regulatory domain-containing protein [Allomuricauda spongiicola]